MKRPTPLKVTFNVGHGAGSSGGAARHRRAVRHQNLEEGHHHPGRRRGVHHDREAGVGAGQQASVPGAAALLLPDHGEEVAISGSACEGSVGCVAC